MKRYAGAVILLAVLLVAGCGNRKASEDAGAGGKLNSATPLSAPAPNSPAGDTNADNPHTGLNTSRPDSQKDLQPGGGAASPGSR